MNFCFLRIGEINNQAHKKNITYVPMQRLIEKGYIININSILVNNNVINISKEFKFYLISGKSFIDFYIDIYNHILSSIEKNCHKFNEAILFLGLILLLKFKSKLNLLIFENNILKYSG